MRSRKSNCNETTNSLCFNMLSKNNRIFYVYILLDTYFLKIQGDVSNFTTITRDKLKKKKKKDSPYIKKVK